MSESVAEAGRHHLLGAAALHALIDHAPDGIFVADAAGSYLYVNDAGCAMLGYTRDELMRQRIQQAVPDTDLGRLDRARAAMIEGTTGATDWTLRRKDGSLLPVEVTARILPDGQWQGFVRDISERRALQAEREALFQQVDADRRQLQTLVDTLPLAVMLYQPDGSIVANRRCEELLGMAVAPAAGSAQYADRIFFADGRPVPCDQLMSARALRGETVIAEEFIVRRPDGFELPVLASAAPITDAGRRTIGGVGVFQDMSERMRLERQVHDNEQLLKSVFDLLPVGIWIADASGQIVGHNPAAERIWCGAPHVGPEQFGEFQGWFVDTGKPIAPDEWAMARAIRNGETCIGELVRIRCFDGSHKTIIHSAAPLRGEDGRITGGIVLNEDITALHAAQERLRASEELFRTVFDLLPVGLWIADREGRITRGNPAGHRIWQGGGDMGPEHYGRQMGWRVDTGKPLLPEEWGIPRALRDGETSTRDLVRIQCFDGSMKTVINWAGPIRSDSGEITGAIAVNEDVTALHQTQEQLRAAVRDREEILALVTHDHAQPAERDHDAGRHGGAQGAQASRRRARARHGRQHDGDRAPDVGAGERPAVGGRGALRRRHAQAGAGQGHCLAGEGGPGGTAAAGARRHRFRNPRPRRAAGRPRRLRPHPACLRQPAGQRLQVHQARGQGDPGRGGAVGWRALLHRQQRPRAARQGARGDVPAVLAGRPGRPARRRPRPGDLPRHRGGARREHLGRAVGRPAGAHLLPAALRAGRDATAVSRWRRLPQSGRVR